MSKVIPFQGTQQNLTRLLEQIKATDPRFYTYIIKNDVLSSGGGVNGWADNLTNAFDKLTGAAQSFYQHQQNRDIMKLQIQRAKEGKPPIAARDYVVPMKVEVDSPELRRELRQTATDAGGEVKKYLPFVAIGGLLLAWALIRAKR